MDDINDTIGLFADAIQKITHAVDNSLTRDFVVVMRDMANGVKEGNILFVCSDEWLPLAVNVIEGFAKLIEVPNLITEKEGIKAVNKSSNSHSSFTSYQDSIREMVHNMDLLCNVVITRTDPNNKIALSRAWFDKALICTMKPDYDNARVCLTKSTSFDPDTRIRAASNERLRNLFKGKVWTLRDGLRIPSIILVMLGSYWLTRLSPWLWIISGFTMAIGIFLLFLIINGRWRFCPDCGKKDAVLFSWQKSTCERCGKQF
jgi:hypothetical protein